MKELDVPKSGRRGTTVTYKSRFGQITRQHVVPHDPRTAVQVSRRRAFGRARFLWGRLSGEQYLAWNNTARGTRTRARLNQSGPLSGYLLFVRINCNRAAIGLPEILDPPDPPRFGRNPVGPLTITNAKGVIALKLSVSGKPAQYTIVLGTKPRSAGTTYVDHFTILGLLPDPDQGMSDITDLYLAKYPVLHPGSRVFIQTLQQINGCQDLPKLTSAIVPEA
jgi:hypothetical protein